MLRQAGQGKLQIAGFEQVHEAACVPACMRDKIANLNSSDLVEGIKDELMLFLGNAAACVLDDDIHLHEAPQHQDAERGMCPGGVRVT